jgi:hypothetical protein
MGRYYNGDIEGKFWFAVQSSLAADRFGVSGCEPNFVDYYFEKDDNLEDLQKELKKIEKTIGLENIKKIDDFFEKVNGYNDKIMEDNGLSVDLWNKHKSEYADYVLGKKIEKCLIENGDCSFTAEL